MKSTVLAAISILAFSPAAALAQALPSVEAVVDTESMQVRANCTSRVFGDDFVSRVDVDGNGSDDVVLNFSRVNCNGSTTRFCSTEGCNVIIYLQDQQGQFAFLGKFLAFNVTFDRPNAMWPSFTAGVGGPECGKGAFQSCLQRYEIRHGVLWLKQRG